MEIKLNPEQVDSYVRDCIMKSAIGTSIETALNKQMHEILSAYDSPVKKAIRDEMNAIVRKLLEEPANQEIIRQAIAKRLTSDTISKLVEYSVHKLQSDIETAISRGEWG